MCVLFVVVWLLSVASCLLFVACWSALLWFVVCFWGDVAGCGLMIDSWLWSVCVVVVVCCWLFVVMLLLVGCCCVV